MINPTPDVIGSARRAAGHTQAQAAAAVGVPARQWQRWEAGDMGIPSSAWWLYQVRAGLSTLDDLPAIPKRQRMSAVR